MAISLIEEFLLLALEDEGGEFADIPETSLSCGIAGAALMDLAIRGKIDSDLTSLWAVDTSPTDSPMLNKILDAIAAEPLRLPAKAWIARLTPQAMKLRDEALAKLCDRGILRREAYNFLWVEKGHKYPVERGGERLEGKRRILALLFNQEIPDPYDIALVAIADACSIFERILTASTLAEAGPRIRQLRRMDLIGAEIADTAQAMNAEIKTAERRTVIAGLAGNVMEWYDFGVYGYFAATVGVLFFPAHDPITSLLASFGVFAVGFLGRPLGALMFGHIGDKHGRKTALMLSVLFMALPTLFIGLLPTYAQIGIAAPVLLVVLRLCQGLAVGGEFATSMVLLVEEAQPSRRGLIGSFAPVGATGGMLLGSLVGAVVTGALSAEQISAWGWRAAFLFGLAIGVVVFFVRRKLKPDETIQSIEHARTSPISEAFRTQWRAIIKIVCALLMLAVGYYTNFVYLSTWLAEYTSLSKPVILSLNAVALASMLVFLPLAGAISDRLGRKQQMLITAVVFSLLALPLFSTVAQGSVWGVILGQLGFAFLQSSTSGVMPAFMVEALPKHVRCTALSFSQNLCMALFGGTVPMVATYLIEVTGNTHVPAYYLLGAAVTSFVAILTFKGTAQRHDLG